MTGPTAPPRAEGASYPSYPDFVGIGAQKAGTTWLSRNLQLHPEVWMPDIKEIHYFDERIDDPSNPVSRLTKRLFGDRDVDRRWRRQVKTRGGRHLRDFSAKEFIWDLKYYMGAPGDGWYASLFEPGRGSVVGEITPAYSTLGREAVAHVHRLMPEAKILLMVRNPIERAWSQAVMRLDKAGKRAVETADPERLRRLFERKGSRARTDYLRTLENWGSFYPEERIFVGFLEDAHLFPAEMLRRVYAFLGVDPSFTPPGANKKVHARSTGTMPAGVAVHLARTHHDDLKELHGRFGGYASFWLYCAERLLEDPPEGDSVPYPLWGSAMWEEWVGGSGPGPEGRPRFGSGPLAARAAAGRDG